MSRYMVHGPYKRTMATNCPAHSKAQSSAREVRTAATKSQKRAQWNPLDSSHRSPLEGFARQVSAQKYMPSSLPRMEQVGGFCQNPNGSGRRLERARPYRFERGIYRRDICSGKKRGAGVGKTKRGKGTKIMGLTDARGLPIAIDTSSASPHEVTLVDDTLDACFLEELPANVIGDKAYDSDPLDERLAEERGVMMIAPHKTNRRKSPTQDGRVLRRYKKRWKVERLFAWLQNFRRLVVRYEYRLENFLGMAQLGCIVILLRRVLG